MPRLDIRLATAEDKAEVLAISATVWEGNDYVPLVFDRWVAEDEREGFLLAGSVDGTVVAIQHVAFQPGDVAWVEGIRVHPDFRGRGFGHEMLRHGLRLAKERSARLARLSTADQNRASIAIVESQGFRQVAAFHMYSAPAGHFSSTAKSLDGVPIEDIEASLHRLRGDGGLAAVRWTAYEIPGQYSLENFPVRFGVGDQDRLSGLALGEERADRDILSLILIGGDRESVRELGLALRSEAETRAVSTAGGSVQATEEVKAGLLDAGYTARDDLVMIVYELPLADPA